MISPTILLKLLWHSANFAQVGRTINETSVQLDTNLPHGSSRSKYVIALNVVSFFFYKKTSTCSNIISGKLVERPKLPSRDKMTQLITESLHVTGPRAGFI